MTRTNTLAYYDMKTITAANSCMVQGAVCFKLNIRSLLMWTTLQSTPKLFPLLSNFRLARKKYVSDEHSSLFCPVVNKKVVESWIAKWQNTRLHTLRSRVRYQDKIWIGVHFVGATVLLCQHIGLPLPIKKINALIRCPGAVL